MWLAVAVPAGCHARMGTAVAESTGKCPVLGLGLFQQGTNLLMTGNTESPRCSHGIAYLQRMMGRMAAKTVTGYLAFGMGLMAVCAFRNLAMRFMAVGAGQFGMSALIVGKILSRAFMAGQTGLFQIVGKMEYQGLMGVRVTG